MSEYFSAAASAKAKQTGQLVRYRSYKTGSYFDKISERYNHVDIFELSAYRIPIDMQKVSWYKENPKEPLLTPAGEDGHIISLSREAHYADQGNYVVLPVKFSAKRFKFASREDLALWEEESSDEGVIFTGSIAGVVPVREILEKSGEDSRLIHPATSDRDELIRQATDSNGLFYSSKTINFHDYEEHFSPVGPCQKFECPICFGPLIHLDKPKVFILGYPENAPQVVSARFKYAKKQKLKYLLRLAKLAQMSMMLSQMMGSADAIDDNPNLSEFYENLS